MCCVASQEDPNSVRRIYRLYSDRTYRSWIRYCGANLCAICDWIVSINQSSEVKGVHYIMTTSHSARTPVGTAHTFVGQCAIVAPGCLCHVYAVLHAFLAPHRLSAECKVARDGSLGEVA